MLDSARLPMNPIIEIQLELLEQIARSTSDALNQETLARVEELSSAIYHEAMTSYCLGKETLRRIVESFTTIASMLNDGKLVGSTRCLQETLECRANEILSVVSILDVPGQ